MSDVSKSKVSDLLPQREPDFDRAQISEMLKQGEVESLIKKKKTALFAHIGDGLFPEPIKLGKHSFWRRDEVELVVAAWAAGRKKGEIQELVKTIRKRREALYENTLAQFNKAA